MKRDAKTGEFQVEKLDVMPVPVVSTVVSEDLINDEGRLRISLIDPSTLGLLDSSPQTTTQVQRKAATPKDDDALTQPQ
jgi:hypothetical protein